MRIDDIKAATAINVEAERKVAQLNDEIQALARTIRVKDQTIQETSVKVELMERRMETVKKQADTITDLENELSKARKQERAYEEAMEQLQTDLDALEQDNAKLKQLAANPERQASTTQVVEPENVPTEGNLETSYLLEQVSSPSSYSSTSPCLTKPSRSTRCAAPCASCGTRTRSSKAKTCSKRSKRCPSSPRCPLPAPRRQRLCRRQPRTHPRASRTTSRVRRARCATSR